MPSFKKISIEDMRGWLREDIFFLLPPSFFKDPAHFIISEGGRIISDSKWRWAGIFQLNSDRNFFLKRDRTKGLIEKLKYLMFPSKARKEWFITYQMRKKNLSVPEPLGWLERYKSGFMVESYYISEAIVSGITLADCQDLLNKERVLSELIKTLLKIHRSGLYHKDLHAGNLIWNGESFYILDLHRAKIVKSLSLKQRLLNIASLLHSLRKVLKENERLEFIEKYFEGEGIYFNGSIFFKKIHHLMDYFQEKQWESRTKRCLKESTNFSINKTNHLLIYHRKEICINIVNELLKKHLEISNKEPKKLIKKDKKSIISCIKVGEDSIYIKQFCYLSLRDKLVGILFLSKGKKGWIGGNGLKVRGISSITPLALLERKHWFLVREDFLFMEGVKDGLEMDRYISAHLNSISNKRRFIKEFAQWVLLLHQKKIYHRDMKTCNIMVKENVESWKFYLLDLEDVRFKEKVNEKKLLKNLIQLNTSIPEVITRTDRLRFFKEYLKLRPIVKDKKALIKEIIKRSKERGIVYVSNDGLVIEK